MDSGIKIGVRFYLSDPNGPHLLFFHGNGEIASDYDDAGPFYQQLGLSLLAMDYRGYGKSQGTPSVGNLLTDVLLKNSGARRKEMVVIPGAGHNDIMFRCGRAYFETIARFANSLKPRGKD